MKSCAWAAGILDRVRCPAQPPPELGAVEAGSAPSALGGDSAHGQVSPMATQGPQCPWMAEQPAVRHVASAPGPPLVTSSL